jgi:hypothetical protein
MITQGSTVEITPPVVIIVVATRIVTAVSSRYDKGSKFLTTFLVYSFTHYFVYSLFTIYLQFVNHFRGKTGIIKT